MQLLRGRTTGIHSLAISPDSRFVVAVSEYHDCDVWDLGDAKPRPRGLSAGGTLSNPMAFPTPTTLLAFHDARWCRHDLAAPGVVTLVGPPLTLRTNLILHPSGNLSKTVGYDLLIEGNVETRLSTLTLAPHGFEPAGPVKVEPGVLRLWGFDPAGGRYLAECREFGRGDYFRLRDAATDEVVTSFHESPAMRAGTPHHWVFAADGRRLFAVGYQCVSAFDCEAGGPPLRELLIGAIPFLGLAAHPGGRVVATVEYPSVVTLRDADTLQPLRSYDFAMPRLTCVAFTPDGMRCVVGNSRGKVLLFDVE